MLTVLTIFGTRPEAIKMAPVIRQLQRHDDKIKSLVCSTGQHGHMLQQVCDLFDIKPDINLSVMQPNQTLAGLTVRLFDALDPLMESVKPDWVLVQGDTTTVMVASLVAYYHRVAVGHVEAGLRTGDRYSPFPEELNRLTADAIAEIMFAPTDISKQALLAEGHPEERIVVTGNTVIDALYMASGMPYDWSAGPLAGIPSDKRLVLITAHRRESFGEPFRELCTAIRELAEHFAGDGVHFVYPVHLNPNVQEPVHNILGSAKNITLLEPLDYLSLVHLMKRSALVVTDSGGIQEEAPALGVPVLVTRETTERPEGINAGSVKLVGTSRERIVREGMKILTDELAHDSMVKKESLYGDGQASRRIVETLLSTRVGEPRTPRIGLAPAMAMGQYISDADQPVEPYTHDIATS